jgi:predicted nuclease of restriction endonuclease-like (RecB) superfamily
MWLLRWDFISFPTTSDRRIAKVIHGKNKNKNQKKLSLLILQIFKIKLAKKKPLKLDFLSLLLI